MRVRIAFNGRPARVVGGAQSVWILCDECGEPISKSRSGIVTFPGDVPPKDVTPRFVHKGTCDDGTAQWNDLDEVLVRLGQGLEVDLPDEATQRGERNLDEEE